MRPRISIRGFVRRSVRGSVGHAFLKYCGNEDFKTIKHQETHRIAFLVEIQENSRKFKKIQKKSRKFKKIKQFIGRIVVRIEPVCNTFPQKIFQGCFCSNDIQNSMCFSNIIIPMGNQTPTYPLALISLYRSWKSCRDFYYR